MYYATGTPGWMRADYRFPPAPEQELSALKAQAQWLGDQLNSLTRRIDEIEGQHPE